MTEPLRRPRRRTLTDRMVKGLPPQRQRYFHPDPEMPGHGVRVLPDGASSFYVITRDVFHKQRWVRLGSTAGIKIAHSRELAREVIKRLKAGLAPFEPPPVVPQSLADVAEQWLKRHVAGLRTAAERERILRRHILPVWRNRVFVEIKRSEVTRLLDAVEDAHGPWVADSVLAVLHAMMSWFVTRDDHYDPPLMAKMRRTPKEARKRTRILNDDELRKVWQAAEANGPFGGFLRLLLLTAQRREKLATLKWSDLDGDVWTIATAPGEKGNPGKVKLPPAALKIIHAQPRMASNPHVFAGRDRGPISGFSTRHSDFKQRCGIEGWTLHDCRRTARSLMSRAGVSSEHAERVLGHVLPGVEGTYNLYRYSPEIADALAKLAALIQAIVNPPTGNVVPLHTSAS